VLSPKAEATDGLGLRHIIFLRHFMFFDAHAKILRRPRWNSRIIFAQLVDVCSNSSDRVQHRMPSIPAFANPSQTLWLPLPEEAIEPGNRGHSTLMQITE
jgi:hypothetical protein